MTQLIRQFFETSSLRVTENIERALAQLASPSLQRLKVKLGDKMYLVDLADVVYFESKEKYTFLHTKEREYMIDETIADLENRLDMTRFIRVHRAHIVNIACIRELTKWFAGRYKVKLKDDRNTELIASRSYADRIRRL